MLVPEERLIRAIENSPKIVKSLFAVVRYACVFFFFLVVRYAWTVFFLLSGKIGSRAPMPLEVLAPSRGNSCPPPPKFLSPYAYVFIPVDRAENRHVTAGRNSARAEVSTRARVLPTSSHLQFRAIIQPGLKVSM